MPTWLIERGYRFGVFAADCHEPPHIPVRGHGDEGKIWLRSLEVVYFRRYTGRQEAAILEIVFDKQALFLERWDEFCGQQTEH